MLSFKPDLIKLLSLIFLLYVVGDIATTLITISISPLGIGSEINPLAHAIYDLYGSTGLILAKLGMFAGLTMISAKAAERNFNVARKILLIFALYSAIIVGINMYTLFTLDHSFQ